MHQTSLPKTRPSAVPTSSYSSLEMYVVSIAWSPAKAMDRSAAKLCNISSCSIGLILWFRPNERDAAAAARKDVASSRVFPRLIPNVCRICVQIPLKFVFSICRVDGFVGEEALVIGLCMLNDIHSEP
jgi:hypothetical protein